MADELSGPESSKPRKRSAVKPVTRVATAKVKTTIHFDAEILKRLDIHATMMEMDRSELVSHLVSTHLRRYVVSDRGNDGNTSGGEAA